MAWYLGNTRIYVLEDARGSKQQIARLQPLASGTVHHVFGYESEVVKLQAKVVGEDNLNYVKSLVTIGSGITLTGDLESLQVLVSTVNVKRDGTIFQSIDGNQSCYAPVFTLDLELYKE